MFKRFFKRISAAAAAAVLLTGCSGNGEPAENKKDGGSGALTWCTYSYYNDHKQFLDLVKEKYPEIDLELISYWGANRTAYSWAQMRADDIPDVFMTTQIYDEELAKERLADLSSYDFIGGVSNAVLDQASIDGGIYLLPINYSMYGIFYNKTWLNEKGRKVPTNFAELEALCKEIEAEGAEPGYIGTWLTGGPFQTFFNLAKTDWLTTPDGVKWERDFLSGNATAVGRWNGTMDYIQKYIDIGMFNVDPDDRNNDAILEDYLNERKAMFCTAVYNISRTTALPDGGDELGIMPYISEDGSKNVYMYSPTCYFGISKRLTEPGNEKKLEDALKIMSLLYSPEGQEALFGSNHATTLSILDNAALSEDAMIYDAQQALHDGRAFKMTYANWDNSVIADMGQVFKDWLRGEEGTSAEQCMKRMDELQTDYLNNADELNFCTAEADFTLEQTAALVGKALGSFAEADAAIIPIGAFHDGSELDAGVTGKLYKGSINTEICTSLCPWLVGEYAVMTMTGAQAKELAAAGYDPNGSGVPFKYVLAERGKGLEDGKTYRVAFLMKSYTEQTAEAYSAEVVKGSIRIILQDYLAEQKAVSPDGNPWE